MHFELIVTLCAPIAVGHIGRSYAFNRLKIRLLYVEALYEGCIMCISDQTIEDYV